MNRRTFLKGIFSATAVAIAIPTSLVTAKALSSARFKKVDFILTRHPKEIFTEFMSPTFKKMRMHDFVNEPTFLANLETYESSFLWEEDKKKFNKIK
jgi:hypothetical protein